MKILIATDGSDYSKAAIEKCCLVIAKPEETSVKIVSAAQVMRSVATEPLPFPLSGGYIEQADTALREQAMSHVTEAKEMISQKFSDSDLSISTEVLNGSAGKAIVEAAEVWEADLIVVGSHGYGFWNRVLVGSVSQAVVHHAPCSVMIVRKS
jgi:nucleotide-binding universal stress UspA family protein